MIRLWFSIIFSALSTVTLYGVATYFTIFRNFPAEQTRPSFVSIGIPALIIALAYSILILPPVYFFICRYLKKNCVYFYATILFLWFFVILVDADFSTTSLYLSATLLLIVLTIAMVSALVFSLTIGKDRKNSEAVSA